MRVRVMCMSCVRVRVCACARVRVCVCPFSFVPPSHNPASLPPFALTTLFRSFSAVLLLVILQEMEWEDDADKFVADEAESTLAKSVVRLLRERPGEEGQGHKRGGKGTTTLRCMCLALPFRLCCCVSFSPHSLHPNRLDPRWRGSACLRRCLLSMCSRCSPPPRAPTHCWRPRRKTSSRASSAVPRTTRAGEEQAGAHRSYTSRQQLLSDCTDAYGGATALEAHHCATQKAGAQFDVELASIDTLAFEQFWL